MTRTRLPAALAVAALSASLLLANSVSHAAGGPSLLLGERNRASSTTTVVNAGKGPALKLRTTKGAPPLGVNSSTVVGGLNADLLDGLDAQAIADGAVTRSSNEITARVPALAEAAADRAVARAGAGTGGPTAPTRLIRVAPWGPGNSAPIASGTYRFSVPATGDYRISLDGLLYPINESGSYRCIVADEQRYFSGDRSAISAPVLSQTGSTEVLALLPLHQQVLTPLDRDRPLIVSCTIDGAFRAIQPVQVVLEPVTTTSLDTTSLN